MYQNPLAAPGQGIDALTSDPSGTAVFVNNKFMVSETRPNSYFTSTPGDLKPTTGLSSAPTIAVDVTASAVAPSDGAVGVMCRSNNSGDTGYILSILQDGEATIVRDDSSSFRTLATLPAGQNPAVITGIADNHIRGICSGGADQPVHLTLVVNGQQVLEATDANNPLSASGTFQLIVAANTQPAVFAFSNLVVQVP